MGVDSKYRVVAWYRNQPLFVAVIGMLAIAIVTIATFVLVDHFALSADEERLEQAAKSYPVARPDPSISEDQYYDIKLGMTMEELREQIGFVPGIVSTVHMKLYDTGSGLTLFEFARLPIKGVGSVTAVFQRDRLVVMGGIQTMGQLCKSCAIDIETGVRAHDQGLPRLKEGSCPVCGSNEPLHLGLF